MSKRRLSGAFFISSPPQIPSTPLCKPLIYSSLHTLEIDAFCNRLKSNDLFTLGKNRGVAPKPSQFRKSFGASRREERKRRVALFQPANGGEPIDGGQIERPSVFYRDAGFGME
jgi:hypothetical protein